MDAATNLLVDVRTPMPDASIVSRTEQDLERVRAFEIRTNADYVTAATDLAAIKARWKEVDAEREELKAPSLEACRRVDNFFRAPLTYLKQAKELLEGKLKAWDKQQEELRKAEQARLDELARQERERKEAEAREIERKAREKADAERAEAERQRQAEEQKRREAEEARKAGDAEAARAAEREASKLATSAAKLENKAEATESKAQEKVATVAAQIVAPIAQRSAPAVSGLSKRKGWGFEIQDESKIPREYLSVDETKIRRVVNALGPQANIPGVRVFPDTTFASKTSR